MIYIFLLLSACQVHEIFVCKYLKTDTIDKANSMDHFCHDLKDK